MRIHVKMIGIMKDKAPANSQIDLPEGGTIEDALCALGLPVQSVQVFAVNGEVQRDRRFVLSADDELAVLPPAGGG